MERPRLPRSPRRRVHAVNAEAYKAVVPASGQGIALAMKYGLQFTQSMMGMMLEGGLPEGGHVAPARHLC